MVTETTPSAEVGMIPRPEWFQELAHDTGFVFPKSCIVFDVETSGLDTERDYIVQIGHLVVEDCKPREPMDIVLDWTRCDAVQHGGMRQRLYEVDHDFRMQGRDYKFNYNRLAEEGVDPVSVLEIYHELFTQHQNAGCHFLTHNGFRYDSKIVASHFRRYLGSTFQFDQHLMIDTGLLEKACQLNMMLEPNESLPSFYNRIEQAIAKGVFWSLDRHCVPKYDLVRKHGLDMRKAHTAGFDCYVTHLLLEEFRSMAGR